MEREKEILEELNALKLKNQLLSEQLKQARLLNENNFQVNSYQNFNISLEDLKVFVDYFEEIDRDEIYNVEGINNGISNNDVASLEGINGSTNNDGINMEDSYTNQNIVKTHDTVSNTTEICSENELIALLPSTSERSNGVASPREQTNQDMNSLDISKVFTPEFQQFLVLAGQIQKLKIFN